MGFVPDHVKEDIRARVNIVEVVGGYVRLKKAGQNFQGLCPFHAEKTPSFSVHEGKQIFHCFGCGVGGDVFEFIKRIDGVDFPEAMRRLAEMAGVTIPATSSGYASAAEAKTADKERTEMRAQLESIARQYRALLLNDPRAEGCREYLRARGIPDSIQEQFALGYAPPDGQTAVEHLRAHDYALPLAVKTGIIRERDSGGYYDYFRGRLMFPIRAPNGQVIGFGGRVLSPEDTPKYLNSSDGPLFHKGRVLYGMDIARPVIRERDEVLVVEGYTDCLALHQAGIPHTVATLGTALTPEHVRTVSRMAARVVLVFDGDEAGHRASLRALDACLAGNVIPSVVRLPAADDPDTFIQREGVQAFARLLDDAPSLLDAACDDVMHNAGRDAHSRAQAVRTCAEWVAHIPDSVTQSFAVRDLARRAGVSESVVMHAVRDSGRANRRRRETVPDADLGKQTLTQDSGEASRIREAEDVIIYYLIHVPGTVEKLAGDASCDAFSDPVAQRVGRLLVAHRREDPHTEEGAVRVDSLVSRLPDPTDQSYLTEVAVRTLPVPPEDPWRPLHDSVRTVKLHRIRERKGILTDRLRQPGVPDEEMGTLLHELNTLNAQEHTLAQEYRRASGGTPPPAR